MKRSTTINLQPVLELDLGSRIGQCRAVPVELGASGPRAFLAAYGADFDVDPYTGMFFYPTDTLKLVLFTESGEILWRRDLGPAVVPGMWFCPVFPFDLDGDSVDELFFVNNVDPRHPLGHSGYRLERLDGRTGRTTGQWQWPGDNWNQSLSYAFRNFILGGHVNGEPVLITAQGTYADMYLQAHRPDMSLHWEKHIAHDEPGARGSHMCPVTDLDGDGNEELMWGERCIELADGRERFCGDRDVYAGHSDVIAPLLDDASGQWHVFTIRETDPQATPRVVLFDNAGKRVWGAVAQGHMDMGWVARLRDEGGHVAMAIRIAEKTCGPDGRFHTGMTELAFDALTGEPVTLPFSVYQTVPVDLNGDGLHELVRGRPGGDGEVLDRHGDVLFRIQGAVAMACKLLDLPGEQLLSYHPEGVVRIWADRNAEDSPAALRRYRNRFYRTNRRLTASGSNLGVLGGV